MTAALQAVGRTLPHSLEAEEYLLSCCLLDGQDVIARATLAGVNPGSFYDPKHEIVYDCLLELYGKQRPIDISIVAEELKTAKKLDQVGGYAFLAQVSSRIPTTAQAGYFIEKVIEQAALRELITRGTSVVENCYNYSGGGVEPLIERASSWVLGALPGAQKDVASWKETIAAVQQRVSNMADPNAPKEHTIPFGFGDLDRVFGSMQPGQLVILAARPSIGKSSLARQIAYYNAAKANNDTIFASLEVMGPSLAMNLAQTLSGISVRAIKPGIHPRDLEDYKAAVAHLGELDRLQVMAASQIRIAALRARARFMRARNRPVRLAVVDYLQLLPDAEPSKGESRAFAVGRVSRGLKQFAIEENCAVLALSQLNRDSAKDGREPALHDLRESGDIEQDADKVIFLHRPQENPLSGLPQPESSLPDEVPSFFVNAIQAKGRDDGTGIVSLNFKRAITRFEQFKK